MHPKRPMVIAPCCTQLHLVCTYRNRTKGNVMSEIIHSRSIAEHLSTLASLLEAEALKASVLGMQSERNLRGEAYRVRTLAEQLWQSDSVIEVASVQGRQIAPASAAGRRRRGGQVKLVSG